MKIKLLQKINLFLLTTSFLFGLFCRNGKFYIHGEGIEYENKITFGFVEYLELTATHNYEFSISIFFIITCSLLAVAYLLYSKRKQSTWSTIFYLIFIASITTIYFILFYNSDRSSYFSYFSFDMNALSLAIYFYSIFIGVLSFLLFFFQVFFKSKIKIKTIEDHLVI